jgi:hypothetical protein
MASKREEEKAFRKLCKYIKQGSLDTIITLAREDWKIPSESSPIYTRYTAYGASLEKPFSDKHNTPMEAVDDLISKNNLQEVSNG